jgi:hypothetical protein
MTELHALAETATVPPTPAEHVPAVAPATLAAWFARSATPGIEHGLGGDGAWRLGSALADGQREYLYAKSPVPVAALWAGPTAEAYLDVTPGLNAQVAFVFLDASGQRLGAFFAGPHQSSTATVPETTKAVRIGIRVSGPGAAAVRGVVLGPDRRVPTVTVAAGRQLVVAAEYPTSTRDRAGRDAHRRVLAMRARGERPEVYHLVPGRSVSFDEVDGIDVIRGSLETLRSVVVARRHEAVVLPVGRRRNA